MTGWRVGWPAAQGRERPGRGQEQPDSDLHGGQRAAIVAWTRDTAAQTMRDRVTRRKKLACPCSARLERVPERRHFYLWCGPRAAAAACAGRLLDGGVLAAQARFGKRARLDQVRPHGARRPARGGLHQGRPDPMVNEPSCWPWGPTLNRRRILPGQWLNCGGARREGQGVSVPASWQAVPHRGRAVRLRQDLYLLIELKRIEALLVSGVD